MSRSAGPSALAILLCHIVMVKLVDRHYPAGLGAQWRMLSEVVDSVLEPGSHFLCDLGEAAPSRRGHWCLPVPVFWRSAERPARPAVVQLGPLDIALEHQTFQKRWLASQMSSSLSEFQFSA